MRVRGCILSAILSLSLHGVVFADNFPREPRMANYRDYASFRHDWERWRQEQIAPGNQVMIHISGYEHPEAARDGLPPGSRLQELDAGSVEMNENLLDGYHPPITVTGPESLDVAVEQATHFVHPVYASRLRYNRTHFYSFPLRQADTPALEGASVDAMPLDDLLHPRIVDILTGLLARASGAVIDSVTGQVERAPGFAMSPAAVPIEHWWGSDPLRSMAAARQPRIELSLR